MEKMTLLGTAGAVADGCRDNMSLVFSAQAPDRSDFHLLLECGGSAAHKLAKLGIAYEALEEILISHAHLDHLYGLPGLLFSMKYRYLQRNAPLRIFCPDAATADIAALLDLFALREKSSFPINIHGLPERENAPVLENEHVVITSTPVDHAPGKPTLAVKIVSKQSGKAVVYSADTTYSERLIRFARGAELLLHECAGLAGQPIPPIHSNALQVGKVAQQSAVRRLVLIHLDTVLNDAPDALIAEVRRHFSGEVVVASDFDAFVI